MRVRRILPLLLCLLFAADLRAATRTFLGVDGNWTNTSNWSGGAVPVDGDTVIINTSSVAINTNTDQTGVDLAALIVDTGYTGLLGTVGAPLKIGATKVVWRGGGDNNYIEGASANFTTVLVSGVGSTGTKNLYVSGSGTVITTLTIKKGTVILSSGTTTRCKLQASGSTEANATLTIVNATVTTLEGRAGATSFTGTGTITNLYLDAHRLTASTGTVTNAYLRGGTFTWSTANTMTLCRVFGGTLDCSKSVVARTITTLDVDEGGTANLDNGIGSITVTTLNSGEGATIKLPATTPQTVTAS